MICVPCAEEKPDQFLPTAGALQNYVPAVAIVGGKSVCAEHLRRAVGDGCNI